MSPETAAVSDAAIRGMVATLVPDWRVEAIDRAAHGTDLVAVLNVATPNGPDRAVLKATTAGFVDPVVARAEPRLLERLADATDIPVPAVYAFRDAHPDYPAPFYLMSYETGENFEDRVDTLDQGARETVLREAGEHLADLHRLGPLPAYGTVGVRDGNLTVLETDGYQRYDDFRAKLLADAEETLESLKDGGFFPELATEPDRFADLVAPLREYLREVVPALPEPAPPRYNFWDYRYGNLLLDPETGETQAVLDWANLSAADPAYNLTKVEGTLLTPARDADSRTATLRERFRTAYTASRADWTFDAAVRERMYVYRLTARLDDMACLPLWYQDATPEERDARAADHRAFVTEYL